MPRHERQREEPALLLGASLALLDRLHGSKLRLGQRPSPVGGVAGAAAPAPGDVPVAVTLRIRRVLLVVRVAARAAFAADANLTLELLADAKLLRDGLFGPR